MRSLTFILTFILVQSVLATPADRRFDAFEYPPETQTQPADNFFWRGKAGKWTVEWKPLWIGAVPEKGTALLLHDALDWKDARVPEPGCWQERHAKVLSVVDTVVSTELRSLEGCSSVSNPKTLERRTWQVTDLKRPTVVQTLSHFFPESEIRNALLAQPLIRDSLARAGQAQKPPRTLAGLVSGLTRLTLIYEAANRECYISLERILSSFAFESVHGNKTSVHLSIDPEGNAACQEKSVQLNLELKTPSALAQKLKLASERKAGFLLSDLASIAPNAETVSRRETPAEEPPAQ